MREQKSKAARQRQYNIFTAQEKAKKAKCAVEIGVTQGYKETGETLSRQKKSSVREWVKRYKTELHPKRKEIDSSPIFELPGKERNRPLLIGK